jgi:hypothetical protein
MKTRDRLRRRPWGIPPRCPGEQHDFEFAMKAAKGLPAHVVARIANGAQHGVNFTGSSKGDILAFFIKDGGLDRKRDNSISGGTDVWTLRKEWWPKFLDTLRKEKRPPTRKQREAAKQAAAEEERREAEAKAEGWTIERVNERLDAVTDRRAKLRKELKALEEERSELWLIGKTLDPRWAFDNYIT